MGVTPVNLARISFNLRAFNLQEALRANQTSLYSVQNQLSTGLRFLRPSEDPLSASKTVSLDGYIDQLSEVQNNLSNVNACLLETESAMQEAVDLVREAYTVSLETVDDTHSAEEREALAVVVNSLLDQLVSVGNRKYLNTYLFAGQGADAPFSFDFDGVYYTGDDQRRTTVVDTDMSTDYFTATGTEFFQAASTRVRGAVDLNPALNAETLITDLRGTSGEGVTLGRIQVTAGTETTTIDLSGAATVGDLVDRLNAEMPTGLSASVGTTGITIVQTTLPPTTVAISDISGGQTARDLGLNVSFAVVAQAGGDLDPKLTLRTEIDDLLAGSGINPAGGLTIRNGSQVVTVNLTGVDTVEELLNRINQTGLGVSASIADDDRRLEILSVVSGTELSIEENGGNVATTLGLRSMYGGTYLSELNDGNGVDTVDGDDLRITTRDGTVVDVDLSNARTLQDVITLINTAGAGAVTASFVTTGNGLLLTDETAGGGTFQIEALNGSGAMIDLGLDVTATGNQLTGDDVNKVITDSAFTALLELREGLETDDRQLISTASQRLDRVLAEMQTVQGRMASQAQMMDLRAERVEAETDAAQILRSDVTDVDYTDAVVRFQQLQTALQANLQTASMVLNLSLLDFL